MSYRNDKTRPYEDVRLPKLDMRRALQAPRC